MTVRCGRQLAQAGLGAARAASAREQNPPAERHGGEIGARSRECAGRPHSTAAGVDGDDAAGRTADGSPAATDHVHDAPERGSRRVGRRSAQTTDQPDRSAPRRELEHGRARRSVLERAAGDHEPAVGRSDGRVAERKRQPGATTRRRARPPRDDAVEPACTGVAADDVGGAVDRRGGLIRARRR